MQRRTNQRNGSRAELSNHRDWSFGLELKQIRKSLSPSFFPLHCPLGGRPLIGKSRHWAEKIMQNRVLAQEKFIGNIDHDKWGKIESFPSWNLFSPSPIESVSKFCLRARNVIENSRRYIFANNNLSWRMIQYVRVIRTCVAFVFSPEEEIGSWGELAKRERDRIGQGDEVWHWTII